jgi:ATP:ADP antiporter, AAA family
LSPGRSPLARLLRRSSEIDAREMPVVIAALVLLFAVFCGYFAVRPVRETVGTILGRERVANLFLATWVSSIAVVMLYATLVARVRRSILLPAIYGAVALLFIVIGAMLQANPHNTTAAAVFFVLISVLNLFIVSVFWSFMLEMLSKEQTKRLFGLIAAGGTAGALVGPVLTDLLVGHIGNSGVLYLGAALFVLAIACQASLMRQRAALPSGASAAAEDRPVGAANPFSGMLLVARSPYLLGIAIFMVLLSSVTTFLYLDQLDIVKHTFSDLAHRTQIFSRIDYTVQALTIAFQFFVTGRVAKRFGVATLLTVVPVLMVAGFLGLAVLGGFAVLVLVMIVRRVGEYAFVRPGREMLYSVVDTKTKYQAKSFNDVPVYRGGDFGAAQLQTLLQHQGFSAAALAGLGAVLAALWGLIGWRLGRQVR